MKGIDRALGIYGHVPALALWRAVEIDIWDDAMRAVPLAPGDPVLDLACGPGLFTGALQLPYKPVGLDVDFGLTKLAARSQVYSSVVVADGTVLPFPEASFAFVFSNSSLEHVRGVERLFGEVNRVLRSGGTLAFIVPTDLFGQALLRPRVLKSLGMVEAAEAAREAVLRDTDTFNRFSAQHWRDLVVSGGLEIVSVTPFMPAGTIRLWEALHYLYTKPFLGFRIADLARRLGRAHVRAAARLLAPSVERGKRSEQAVQLLIIARRKPRAGQT
jgi:SAM-dependent methyltransferase